MVNERYIPLLPAASGATTAAIMAQVAAHLDSVRREALFAALATLPAQSFLTGTDAEVFRPLAGIADRFRASPGKLVPEGESGSL